MGIRVDKETERRLLDMCRPTTVTFTPEREKPTLVEPGIAIEPTRVTILIAHATKNELNQRAWKAKNRRAGEAWRRVREAIGPHLGALEQYARHYAQGGALRVTFTRLGGRHLDQLCNLGGALKGVEDAVCYLLGADDGNPQWHPIPAQECGGPVGVRVDIEKVQS